MHWGPEYLSGRGSSGEPLAGVNALTIPAFCPVSKQPELKHAAVKILKAELPWSLLGVAWLPEGEALAAREALRALMPQFSFASCVPFSSPAPVDAPSPTSTGATKTLTRAGLLTARRAPACCFARPPTTRPTQPCSAGSSAGSAWPVTRPCNTPTQQRVSAAR